MLDSNIEKQLNYVLKDTDFSNLGEKYTGKVRDVYTSDNKVFLITTDRQSAFDINLANIPFKGQVLTQTSAFWFENTKDIVQNHVIDEFQQGSWQTLLDEVWQANGIRLINV